ncbi:MAG: 3-deoxy-8-phosphooctulonate synthase [Desulfatibacillaceae bacterium]
MKTVAVKDIHVGNGAPLALIAGPCVIETRDVALRIAERARDLAWKAGLPYIFKASYDKANRSSLESFRGPGLEEGLRILEEIRDTVGVPVLSDVHSPAEAAAAGPVLDVLQIPAFLCRQTDLLVAAGKTGKPVNVKKGQFMAPWDMGNVADKVASTGNSDILFTERGAMFGYNNLVVDMRGISIMQGLGWPVVFDATHSVQLPGGRGTCSGGNPEHAPVLARAAVAAGADAVFFEVHEDPARALCDGANSLRLDDFSMVLKQLAAIRAALETGD